MTKLAPGTPVVYLDESCIHHHYARHHDSDSLCDPTDDGVVKDKHKSRHLCFIDGLDIFQGGAKPRHEPKDYRGMFVHDY
ncbi:hypothetical protein H310_12209 [Aphanomyces invadans]|uniref:Uncharacterized protein n=1 Tax=Aphanomyces invadans TaxID=157072 RepID=A0A024TKK5_9STRA|nr:hypothetical protein H310_12209 [Aphanomyces invadans]ETV93857.1 hypothetical protein H310_12209 [Aphanomyces invadans]|eukprot:XP_008877417.1 hypothetical protein H310_12209 [Aphanomyces invadans]